ncbi:sodium ABC transporter ATP-binding protein [Paenibacillus sambharensis]|uniref:Sodium ABC transporter ATP-binding protein n=1 Tax=Paenibacillus sambharensis TaxID=1803190 RepID=A0A2W1LY45_9BACL|nr:ABC transporter ATP-binding protein [Paenibacillus sambharensis]PZD96437.1 sodium ABC transporter ATP-binding protein [Paenibacillus sambharensis]
MNQDENVIELDGLSKSYSRFRLEPVTMSFKQGYITGLVGPNGAGKSTLIKLIMGMAVPSSGGVKIFGRRMPERELEIKERIGYVSDECHYYEHLSIGAMKNVLAPFYSRWDEKQYSQLLERFELHPKSKIRSLSKGMKMKLSLAFALSHHADLLIMDEPTAGLDPVFRRELLDMLADFIQDDTRTIIFSTHVTTDLDRIADYIAFMNKGSLVFCDSKEEIFERYALVKADNSLLDRDTRGALLGIRETSVGFEGLSADRKEAERLFGGFAHIETPTLEDIMFYTAKGRSGAHV